MLTIERFLANGLASGLITDEKPRFQFALTSDKNDTNLDKATLTFSNGVVITSDKQYDIVYEGQALKPFTTYTVDLVATSNHGEEAKATLTFQTGRMGTPFKGKWISDSTYEFTEKGISPKVLTFKKELDLSKKVTKAVIDMTALGLYSLEVNGKRATENYFAPGFTSYHHQMQYQTYDVTSLLQDGKNDLIISVAGGWAIGAFVFTRVNREYGKRQALLLDLRLTYEDGSEEVIGSDTSFLVSQESPYLLADIYDGETYDSNKTYEKLSYHNSSLEDIGFTPKLLADYSSPVRVRDILKPTYIHNVGNKDIFDFGQNFAGIIRLKIKNSKGNETVIIHHAEVLNEDGSLNLSLLRTAKATLTYITKEGEQVYSPTFTYMGFRYISLEGINREDVEIEGLLLSSLDTTYASFESSNKDLNRLNKNIFYSALANFMDIPTDCPQRDERMGWTGDISIFAATACYNFETNRFLRKWLKDLKSEQLKTGGIPNTIPIHGYGFPATMPEMAIDFWGDAVLNVPYALYETYGDKSILEEMYEPMKKYVNACKFWANLIGVGKYRYIWHTPSLFHFGDWVSPDVDKMSTWQKRSKYTATASLCYTSKLLSKIASLLGKEEDAKKYSELSKKVANAYSSVFMDDNGKLKKEEFQTGYVLPIAFEMLDEEKKKGAVSHLVKLIEKNDYCIGTGFPGTPYILYALADNGYSDVAYKMLLNKKSPSWLYSVSVGGTTIWEKFDGMNPDGTARKSTDGTDNMISFNHYASGSVGNYLYTRLAGLRIIKPGYQEFEVNPVFTREIEEVSTSTMTPYGEIKISYKHHDGEGEIHIHVPVSTKCTLTLPNVQKRTLGSGDYVEKITF